MRTIRPEGPVGYELHFDSLRCKGGQAFRILSMTRHDNTIILKWQYSFPTLDEIITETDIYTYYVVKLVTTPLV